MMQIYIQRCIFLNMKLIFLATILQTTMIVMMMVMMTIMMLMMVVKIITVLWALMKRTGFCGQELIFSVHPRSSNGEKDHLRIFVGTKESGGRSRSIIGSFLMNKRLTDHCSHLETICISKSFPFFCESFTKTGHGI